MVGYVGFKQEGQLCHAEQACLASASALTENQLGSALGVQTLPAELDADDAESVALAADGSLWMLDKFGYVWRAPEDGKGSYAMESKPIAQLGPGRPLGFDFDEEGNLVVCNSGSVRCVTPATRPCPACSRALPLAAYCKGWQVLPGCPPARPEQLSWGLDTSNFWLQKQLGLDLWTC